MVQISVELPRCSVAKNPPAKQKARVWSLGQEDPLEKEMATHSSILAWKIPWMEEPGGLQFTGSQRVRRNLEISSNRKGLCGSKRVDYSAASGVCFCTDAHLNPGHKCCHQTPDILEFYQAQWIQRSPEFPFSPLIWGIQFDGSISHYHLWPTCNSHPRGSRWPELPQRFKGVCLDKFRGHILELASRTSPYAKVTFLLKTLWKWKH